MSELRKQPYRHVAEPPSKCTACGHVIDAMYAVQDTEGALPAMQFHKRDAWTAARDYFVCSPSRDYLYMTVKVVTPHGDIRYYRVENDLNYDEFWYVKVTDIEAP